MQRFVNYFHFSAHSAVQRDVKGCYSSNIITLTPEPYWLAVMVSSF
jgi:hypothetical protein